MSQDVAGRRKGRSTLVLIAAFASSVPKPDAWLAGARKIEGEGRPVGK